VKQKELWASQRAQERFSYDDEQLYQKIYEEAWLNGFDSAKELILNNGYTNAKSEDDMKTVDEAVKLIKPVGEGEINA
jgi:hypothetical protein